MDLNQFSRIYFEILNTTLLGLNLTAIKDYESFHKKQIIDSIGPLEQSDYFRGILMESRPHVDIGFGGGFPLLPLAFKLPTKKFLGFEARNKKVEAVKLLANKLDIQNVNVFHERIENVLFDCSCSISFKAVGSIGAFLSKIKTTQPVDVFFYKGPNFKQDEGEQIQEVSKEWTLVCEDEVVIDGIEKRFIIGFRSKKVPRGTNNYSGQGLVKLSSFL